MADRGDGYGRCMAALARKVHVLLVEDDECTLRVVEQLLKTCQYAGATPGGGRSGPRGARLHARGAGPGGLAQPGFPLDCRAGSHRVPESTECGRGGALCPGSVERPRRRRAEACSLRPERQTRQVANDGNLQLFVGLGRPSG